MQQQQHALVFLYTACFGEAGRYRVPDGCFVICNAAWRQAGRQGFPLWVQVSMRSYCRQDLPALDLGLKARFAAGLMKTSPSMVFGIIMSLYSGVLQKEKMGVGGSISFLIGASGESPAWCKDLSNPEGMTSDTSLIQKLMTVLCTLRQLSVCINIHTTKSSPSSLKSDVCLGLQLPGLRGMTMSGSFTRKRKR